MENNVVAPRRPEAQDREAFYIGGEWVSPRGSAETVEILDSGTEGVLGTVVLGSGEDVDAAVRAARAAFPEWAALTPARRSEHLQAIAAALAGRQREIAEVVACEVGTPVEIGMGLQAGIGPLDFELTASALASVAAEEEVDHTIVAREPIGVVGAITPWNYPLHQIAAKAAAALAAGCTIVVKPSELAPFSAFVLAEACAEAGLPAGVLNLVAGTGPEVGEALVSHPEVDAVSLTGSTRSGRRVSELAAQSIKRVTLELGGKSPNVILDDADLDAAVRAGVANCYLNSGQTCIAFTRMLVPRAALAEVEEIAVDAAESFVVGDPLDPATTLGPLVSARQRDRVLDYIGKGQDEGARLLTGGAERPEGCPTGYYVRPTVFSAVDNEMRIAREEIFGPVLSVIPYDSEEEAIEIANDTPYGLSGGVWSADVDRAVAVARRLRTGTVDVNGAEFNMNAPFGGYKQSGNGRELGRYGIEEYLETKAINRPA